MKREAERNPDVPGVHQYVRQSGKWPGDRRIQPVVGPLAEGLCDVGGRIAGPTARELVDRAVESAVPKCSPLKSPEAVGEHADEMGGDRLDVPSRAQARGA
jgi:hypothetical protein